MIRNIAFATDCRRDFDTVSTRYQKRVGNLKKQTADAFLIPYQDRVRSNSYNSKIFLQLDRGQSDRAHGARIRSQQIVLAPDAASAASATGNHPGLVDRRGWS